MCIGDANSLLFIQVALLDNEDMNAVDGDDDWQFVSIGEQQNFGIRTAGLEEKATACQMLVCYARELKEGFADYTEQVRYISDSWLFCSTSKMGYLGYHFCQILLDFIWE